MVGLQQKKQDKQQMVQPERQRERQRPRYSRNRSPSEDDDRHRRRSRSRSDSRDRKRSRDYRDYKQRSHHSHSRSSSGPYDRYDRPTHSKKRSQSRQLSLTNLPSESDTYKQRQDEQLQQKIRFALRNNDLHYNKVLQQTYMHMPERKQQELAFQARSPEKIHQMILVRELFISGLNDINQFTITELMGRYGDIENIEIIKDFAFVKYFRVEDASNACADYHHINASVQPLINSNFKIFFSDHLKRWNVVSNNPEYEVTQYLVPVLYVSLKNDPYYANQKYLHSIFKKYGFIRNLQLRKNEFPGPKIHVNVEYQTLQMAIRARDRLKNKKEKLFGQKKAEIAILIDSEKLIRTFPNVSNQIRYQKKRFQGMSQGMNPMMSSVNAYSNLPPMDSYQPPMNPPMSAQNPMIPQPPPSSSYQTEDIFAMLQKLNQKKQEVQIEPQAEQDADWVGFFTRNNQFKVEVEFNRIHKDVPFNLEVILNVSHRGDINEALNRTDYALAGKFKAVNKLNQQAFSEYIKYFTKKNKGGVIFSNEYLIYLLPPKQDLNLPYKVNPNELLAFFFKIKN